MKHDPDELKFGPAARIGLVLAAIVYLFSVAATQCTSTDGKPAPGGDLIVIRVAHWQLEAGAREGWEKVFRAFEEEQLRRHGRRVEVRQVAIPEQGYTQWQMTQFVSGDPVEVIKTRNLSNDMMDRYFLPLGEQLGSPNPFNDGTPLENIPWRDTFIDGMLGSYNADYGDYYTVPTSVDTLRLYGNLDLIEAATGERRMPESLAEWLAVNQALLDYGRAQRKTIIPVVSQFTPQLLSSTYFSFTNGALAEKNRYLEPGIEISDMNAALASGELEPERMLAFGKVLDAFQPFVGNGFDTMSRDMASYLFSSGMAGFKPSGAWDAESILSTAPFEVGIGRLPPIGPGELLSEFSTGPFSETGSPSGGGFGVTRRSSHHDISLELLQFMTAWQWNQLAMFTARWLPVVRNADYPAEMEVLKPMVEGYPQPTFPLLKLWGGADPAGIASLQALTRILKGVTTSAEELPRALREVRPLLGADLIESRNQLHRTRLRNEERRIRRVLAISPKDAAADQRAEILADLAEVELLKRKLRIDENIAAAGNNPEPPEKRHAR